MNLALQRKEALDRANQIRLKRAHVKRALRAGAMTVAEALTIPEIQGMPLYDLLKAQWAWGDYKATQFFRGLARASMPAAMDLKVCELNERQLRAVEEMVG